MQRRFVVILGLCFIVGLVVVSIVLAAMNHAARRRARARQLGSHLTNQPPSACALCAIMKRGQSLPASLQESFSTAPSAMQTSAMQTTQVLDNGGHTSTATVASTATTASDIGDRMMLGGGAGRRVALLKSELH